jgi:hypothetical protein
MSHGFGSYAWNARFGTRAGRFNPRLGRFRCSLLRTPVPTFRIGGSKQALHLLVLALLVVGTLICFVGFVAMLIVFLALPDDADLALGMGLERPGTCRGAFCYQHWSRGDLQIQDRETVFSGHLR